MDKGVKQATSKWNSSGESFHFAVSGIDPPSIHSLPGAAWIVPAPVGDLPLTIVRGLAGKGQQRATSGMFLTSIFVFRV